jgi:hypothetical protein
MPGASALELERNTGLLDSVSYVVTASGVHRVSEYGAAQIAGQRSEHQLPNLPHPQFGHQIAAFWLDVKQTATYGEFISAPQHSQQKGIVHWAQTA